MEMREGSCQLEGLYLVDILLCPLRVEDCGFVAIVEEVSCSNQAVASYAGIRVRHHG